MGRFVLQQFLGEGGMGSVWLAEDPTRKDDVRDGLVVLKFLRDDIRRCPEAVEQFKSSYRRVQQLFHEHICPLLDLGDDDRFGAFQVMPFVRGMTLLELLKKEDPNRNGLPPARVVAILQPVAKALDYAHREGLIHRDIKPGNIMVDPQTGKVFVVDFGLAAEVRTSMSMHSRSAMQVSGTEPYMAPEQWLGQAQDGRSDQYSLAVVAWQMLTGSLPYQGSGMQLGFAVTNGPIPQLQSPHRPLRDVFAKALAKDRKDRFETCRAFLSTFEATNVFSENDKLDALNESERTTTPPRSTSSSPSNGNVGRDKRENASTAIPLTDSVKRSFGTESTESHVGKSSFAVSNEDAITSHTIVSIINSTYVSRRFWYLGTPIYTIPNIPNALLNNACIAAAVPTSENVVGVLSFGIWFWARYVVFTEARIYYGTIRNLGRDSISYSDLKQLNFRWRVGWPATVEIGDKKNWAMGGQCGFLVDLLTRLKLAHSQ
ncbi:MAG: serine/threonine protein kinase [Planctomycetaceae bacterium]|nr:serine/threonine protein kinase [Planctomycetaceae bacterium]